MAFIMVRKSVLSLLFFLMLTFPLLELRAQSEELNKVYIVWVDVEKPADIAKCYTTRFDKKKVEVLFDWEDTINSLEDFIFEEDPLVGPDCFVPEIKLVFKSYTYLISLYCSKVLKYKNNAAYVTSNQRIKNDLAITQSVYNYLNALRIKHFNQREPNRALIAKVVTGEPLVELTEDDSDFQILVSEDEQDPDESLGLEPLKEEKPVVVEEDDIDLEELDDEDDASKKTGAKPAGKTTPKPSQRKN